MSNSKVHKLIIVEGGKGFACYLSEMYMMSPLCIKSLLMLKYIECNNHSCPLYYNN